MKNIYCLVVLFVHFALKADVIDPHLITPETVLQSHRDNAENDSELRRVVAIFFERFACKHPELLDRMLGRSRCLSETREYRVETMAMLEAAGYKSLSPHNYVFVVEQDGVTFFVKISGQGNRTFNDLRQFGFDESESRNGYYFGRAMGGRLTAEEKEAFDLYMKKKIEEGEAQTYQTSSRAATNLLIAGHISAPLGVTKMHILTVDGSDNVADSNVVIFEAFEPGCLLEEWLQDHNLSDDVVEQLCRVIFGAYLWNLTKNVVVRQNGDVVVIVDTEQPNKMAPSQAFFKNKKDLERNVCAGLESLLVILKNSGKSVDSVLKFVAEHPELRDYFGYSDILKQHVES